MFVFFALNEFCNIFTTFSSYFFLRTSITIRINTFFREFFWLSLTPAGNGERLFKVVEINAVDYFAVASEQVVVAPAGPNILNSVNTFIVKKLVRFNDFFNWPVRINVLASRELRLCKCL